MGKEGKEWTVKDVDSITIISNKMDYICLELTELNETLEKNNRTLLKMLESMQKTT